MSSQYVRSRLRRIDTVTALTATPQVSAAISIGDSNRLDLLVNFTFVAGTAVIFTFDVSNDGVTWYEVSSTDVAAGTGTRVKYTDSTATGSASKKFRVSLADVLEPYIRYNISATAGSTDSALVEVNTGYSA